MEEGADPGLVLVGRVIGAHGVKGWIRVRSDTDPPGNLLGYAPWWLGHEGRFREVSLAEVRETGGRVMARVAGCEDRDGALALVGLDVAVPRARLPALDAQSYYWAELVGLEVVTREGRSLGTVTRLMETGANDVLVVGGERERLVPWLPGQVVIEVDRGLGRIVVDWDPEF